MIESHYWKEDLLKHAKTLKPIEKPPRWSERLVVNFEKNLITSFFLVRKLFETNKVSRISKSYKAEVFCCKPSVKKITKLNQHSIDKIYNLKKEHSVKKDIIFIANQLIHSCTIFAYRESLKDRNWGGVYACSDYERNKTIYRIPISEIIKIFQLVNNDYPSGIRMIWDSGSNDYKVKTE